MISSSTGFKTSSFFKKSLEKVSRLVYHINMNKNGKQNLQTITAEDGGFAFSFSVISILLISIIYSTVLSVIAGKNLSVFSSNAVIILNYVLSPIAILLAIGILRYKNKKNYIALATNKKFEIKPLIATLLIGFGLTFGLAEINAIFVTFLQGLGLKISTPSLPSYSPINVILVILSVCVLPSIFEEFLFRGIILSSLKKTGVVFATLISGALFSLFHMSPAQTVYQFIVGVIYSLIIICGGNLLYTIIIHFINNLYIVLNYYYFNITVDLGLTLLGLISLAVGIVLLVYKRREISLDKAEKKQNRTNFLLGAIMGAIASLFMWIQGLI